MANITSLSLDAINNALDYAHETLDLEADWEKSLVEDEAQPEPAFDWSAILAEEEAKRLAFEASTFHEGFLIRDLRAAFDAVANRENWKMPIGAAIKAEDREVTAKGIEFFTGSKATFESLPNGKLLVSAEGYYRAVGA